MINILKNPVSIKHASVFGFISALLLTISCQLISATSIPGPTATSEKLNTPTPTSTSLPTSTAVPTLTSDEAQKVMYKLLKSNGGCVDLCFWGIIPGKSTDKEVLEKFGQLGIEGYEVADQSGNLSHYDTRLDMFTQNPIVISIEFENGIVSNVLGEIYYLGKPEISSSDWQAFSLSSILKSYGAPSEVLVSANPPNISNPQYAYALNYVNPDLSVVYLSNEIKNTKNKQYEICPMSEEHDQSFSIFFFAGNDHDKNLHERFLTEGKWMDISAISDLSSQMFYSLFLNSDKDTCITIGSEPFQEQ